MRKFLTGAHLIKSLINERGFNGIAEVQSFMQKGLTSQLTFVKINLLISKVGKIVPLNIIMKLDYKAPLNAFE